MASTALRLAAAVLACAGGARAATADYVVTLAQAGHEWAKSKDTLLLVVVGEDGSTSAQSFTPPFDAAGQAFEVKFSDVDVGDVTAVKVQDKKQNAYCFVDLKVTVDGDTYFDDCGGAAPMVCVSGEKGDCNNFPGAALCEDEGQFLSVPVSDCMVDFVVSFKQAALLHSVTGNTKLDLVVVGERGATPPTQFDPTDGKGALTKVPFAAVGVGAVTGVKVRNPGIDVYCLVGLTVAENGAVAYQDCDDKIVCVGTRPAGWCEEVFPGADLCVDDGTYADVPVAAAGSCPASWAAAAHWAQAQAAAHPAAAGFAAGAALALVALAARGYLAERDTDADYKPLPV